MSTADKVIKDIKNKNLASIYFLMGEEPFFIDRITKVIEEEVLTEAEKEFNQHIFYGNDVDTQTIISLAKQYPMGADRQVIIVKEAQHLWRTIDELDSYAKNPQPTTVLVFNYKGKSLDGRKALARQLRKNHVILNFEKVRDYKIGQWIEETVQSMGMQIDAKSKFLLGEFLGTDLGRIYSELQKLKMLSADGKITPELIERNIGINKDYNNFELQSALEEGNLAKAFAISNYFRQNPKDNPLVVTLAVLYNMFSKLIIYHTLSDKSQQNVAGALKVPPFIAQKIIASSRRYPLKKTTRIISLLRETDVKSKGIGATGNVSQSELLNELIYKIAAV